MDRSVTDYYERFPEEDRLTQGEFLLEGLRTRELIERHIPDPPGVVLDVGGGAGTYALWLAERGYTVHLRDSTPRLVEEARRRSTLAPQALMSCEIGDARALDFSESTADVFLLLGPLYHLTSRSDRIRALAESHRVLKPGGLLFAAAISRWASLLDGLRRDCLRDPEFSAIVERDLRDGQHRNATTRLDYFTTAYFHRPEELRDEAASVGFVVENLYGIEGHGWLFADLEERLQNPKRRADLLRAARLLEAEPSLLGVSAHWLLFARKI